MMAPRASTDRYMEYNKNISRTGGSFDGLGGENELRWRQVTPIAWAVLLALSPTGCEGEGELIPSAL
jgi:hypothetical protein